MRFARPTLAAAAAGAALALLPTVAVAATTVDTVYPNRIGADWHTADTRAGGSLSFETTYGGALGSSGAVVLDTSDSSAQKAQLFTDDWDGTRLVDITALSYSTYQAVAPTGSVVLPALNIRLDRDGDGDVDAYLVFEPYADKGNNTAVLSQQWQTWDAVRGGEAIWWSGQIPECPPISGCTWDRVVELFPNATILEDPTSLRGGATEVPNLYGSIGFNQGTGNAGVVGAADALRIATATRDVTYNFEPAVTLTGKTQCKDGGWATSTDPVFRNQGDCVSYFASGGKTHPQS